MTLSPLEEGKPFSIYHPDIVWEDVTAELEDVLDLGDDRVVAVLNCRGCGRVSGVEVQLRRMAGIFTTRVSTRDAGRLVSDEAEDLAASGIELRPTTPDE